MKLRLVVLLAFVLAGGVGCLGGSNNNGSSGGGGGSDPTPTPEPPGGSGTNVIGLPGFCEIGDTATLIPDDTGSIRFSLPPVGFTSTSDCSNGDDRDVTDDEYYFIFFNSTSASYELEVTTLDNIDPPSTSAKTGGEGSGSSGTGETLEQAFNTVLAQPGHQDEDQLYAHQLYNTLSAAGELNYPLGGGGGGGPFNLSFKNGDAVGDEIPFRFASDVDNINVCSEHSGIVQFIGDHARIVIDRDLPYDAADTHPECENTDLTNPFNRILCLGAIQRLSNIIDNNLEPLLTSLAGDIPDVDGDGLMTIIITQRMNSIGDTDGDPNDLPVAAVHGYFEASSLLPFDPVTNPCSTEDFTIFAHAPDPKALYSTVAIDLTEYANADLPAAVAFQMEKGISFNEKVLQGGGNPEDAWLSNALGLLFVDLAGFYTESLFMSRLTSYLDVPSYISVTSTRRWHDNPALGFQYLLGTYLAHSQVDTSDEPDGNGIDADLGFITNFYGAVTGIDNIEAAVAFDFDEDIETEFEAIFKFLSVAAAVEGTAAEKSGTTFPYYLTQNTTRFGSGIANASGSTRAGADGGSLDIDANPNNVFVNLNGENVVPTSLGLTSTFLFENPDRFTFAPGNDFDGFVETLALNFVRVGGLFEATTNFQIDFSSANGSGFVVRVPDITYPVVHSESIHGTIDVTREVIGTSTVNYDTAVNEALAASDERTRKLVIVGEFDEPQFHPIFNVDSNDTTLEPIADLDFYNITIPSTAAGSLDPTDLAVWVELQPTSDGTTGAQPMLAIVSSDDVPDLNLLSDAATGVDLLPDMRFVINRVDPTGATEEFVTVEDIADVGTGACGGGLVDRSPAAIADNDDFFWGFTINNIQKNLFVLVPNPADPDFDDGADPAIYYEPRSQQTVELLCDAGAAVDDPDDSADDFIGRDELKQPALFQEQILTYMARERDFSFDGGTFTFDSNHPLRNQTGTEDPGTQDMLAVDIDSRDTAPGVQGTVKDRGNNLGGYSVKNIENSVLQEGLDSINPLLRVDIPIPSGFNQATLETAGFNIEMQFEPVGAVPTTIDLNASRTYTIVVGSILEPGRYELHMRAFNPSKASRVQTLIAFPE